jgi:hypothetical protein
MRPLKAQKSHRSRGAGLPPYQEFQGSSDAHCHPATAFKSRRFDGDQFLLRRADTDESEARFLLGNECCSALPCLNVFSQTHWWSMMPDVEMRKLPAQGSNQLCVASHHGNAIILSEYAGENDLCQVASRNDSQPDPAHARKTSEDFAVA